MCKVKLLAALPANMGGTARAIMQWLAQLAVPFVIRSSTTDHLHSLPVLYLASELDESDMSVLSSIEQHGAAVPSQFGAGCTDATMVEPVVTNRWM